MKNKLNLIGIILLVFGILTVAVTMFVIDFSFENMVTVTEKTNDVKGEFTSIEIVAEDADVTILPSTNGKCTITTRYKKGGEINHTVKDGKLLVEENEANFAMFNFSSNSIVLYLPQEAYSALKIDGSSCDIDISGVKFDTAEIDVSSGEVSLKNMKLTSLYIEGSSGEIELENVEVEKGASIKASTADVKVINSRVGENLSVELRTGELTVETATVGNVSAEVTSGDIELENLVSLGEIKLKVSTADIELDGCDASTIDIETSTGDVMGKLLSSKIFYVTTSTGDVSVPKSTEGGICQVKTSTGDVTFTISK